MADLTEQGGRMEEELFDDLNIIPPEDGGGYEFIIKSKFKNEEKMKIDENENEKEKDIKEVLLAIQDNQGEYDSFWDKEMDDNFILPASNDDERRMEMDSSI